MANTFLDMVKKKLETPDHVKLSAGDRALIEQTYNGFEEIKKQRESELAALAELKDLINSNNAKSEVFDFAGEYTKIQTALDETLKRIEVAQGATEKAILMAISEETYLVKKIQRRFSSIAWLCVCAFLTSLGTLAVFVLNIFGII